MTRRVVQIVISLVLVLGVGGATYLRLHKTAAASGMHNTGPDSATRAAASGTFATDIFIPVRGIPVVKDTLIISVSAAAQAAASRQVKLLSQVNARVNRVLVREDMAVAEGATVVALDTTDLALSLGSARAAFRSAQATYRDQTLFDSQIADSVVRAERDRVARAKSGLDASEIGVRRAELDLQHARVTAPFDGRVASIGVVQGQWVRPGDSLLTVVDLDPIKVEVQVLESEVGYLAAGRRAAVTFAAFPGEVFRGIIATINPIVDKDTRTARVTVTVPNADGRVLPGMYARVSLEARKFADRILVPRAAVLERDRRTMVFVFSGEGEQGLAKWRYVTTGLQNDSLVEIVANPETEMVRPGEIVLTDGHYTLIHDAKVRLVQSVRAAGGRPQ